jgi:hypothetical protein
VCEPVTQRKEDESAGTYPKWLLLHALVAHVCDLFGRLDSTRPCHDSGVR